MPSARRRVGRLRRRAGCPCRRVGCLRAPAIAGALVLLVGLSAAGAARAGTANAGLRSASRRDPIAGLRWGVYTGSADNSVYPYYAAARGRRRTLLARIALRPQAFSFGAWYSDSEIESVVRAYIANVTGGNPDVLAQLTVFRMDPWEGQACPHGRWSSRDQASYRTWIRGLARGIGDSRVALVLQPDMPFATCAGSDVPYRLISFSARLLSGLPHVTVYLDAGARYWPMPFSSAVSMLERAGIRYARGFALDDTEYDSTGAELEYGARLADALAAGGYGEKHFVINTAENGSPFLNGQYPGNVGNPRVCRSSHEALCATLGIPPTAQTARAAWHLTAAERAIAAREADAYLWVGRPWLDYGAAPFDLARALGLAASTPF